MLRGYKSEKQINIKCKAQPVYILNIVNKKQIKIIRFYIMALFKGEIERQVEERKKTVLKTLKRDTDGWSKTQRFQESTHMYYTHIHICTYVSN